jgi:hypothetical protein
MRFKLKTKMEENKIENQVVQIKNEIFEAKHFRWLVFSSFTIVLFLIIFLLLNPDYLDFEIIRFLVLILISLYLSLMFFILWPHNATLEKIPFLDLSVKVAGPVVLWIVIFTLTNNLMPSDNNQERMYIINKASETYRIPYHQTFLKCNDTSVDYMLVEDPINKSNLKAVFVKFPKGKSIIKVRLEFARYKPVDLILTRTMPSIFINKLEKNE